MIEIETYDQIRSGGAGSYGQPRGLVAVRGGEAVQFLDGLITNDVKTLADGQEMLAAFPNAQGRLLAVVRVLRHADRFLIETEASTRDTIFQNLFRFTYAGDFLVEDISDQYKYFESFGPLGPTAAGGLTFSKGRTQGHFVPVEAAEAFVHDAAAGGRTAINDELYELLRIENGVPVYGLDMDETTIVPELGIDGLISYKKGCYIGQEIIARIYFRGHVAKQLSGLIGAAEGAANGFLPGAILTTPDGKNAGRVTSVAFSPKLDRTIGLAYVRYEHLAEETSLLAGEHAVAVKTLPFFTQTIA